jgi:hypothetical protein
VRVGPSGYDGPCNMQIACRHPTGTENEQRQQLWQEFGQETFPLVYKDCKGRSIAQIRVSRWKTEQRTVVCHPSLHVKSLSFFFCCFRISGGRRVSISSRITIRRRVASTSSPQFFSDCKLMQGRYSLRVEVYVHSSTHQFRLCVQISTTSSSTRLPGSLTRNTIGKQRHVRILSGAENEQSDGAVFPAFTQRDRGETKLWEKVQNSCLFKHRFDPPRQMLAPTIG